MALRNYFREGSYSRVENVIFDKELKVFNFRLSVYTDDTASEKILEKPFRTTGYARCREITALDEATADDTFVVCNGIYYQKIPGDITSGQEPAYAHADGSITDHFFNTFFSIECQQKYTDILAFTYAYILTLPEFSGLASC
jgi:hypothetical protein